MITESLPLRRTMIELTFLFIPCRILSFIAGLLLANLRSAMAVPHPTIGRVAGVAAAQGVFRLILRVSQPAYPMGQQSFVEPPAAVRRSVARRGAVKPTSSAIRALPDSIRQHRVTLSCNICGFQ